MGAPLQPTAAPAAAAPHACAAHLAVPGLGGLR